MVSVTLVGPWLRLTALRGGSWWLLNRWSLASPPPSPTWGPMESHEAHRDPWGPWGGLGGPGGPYEAPWGPMELHRAPWGPIGPHGAPWGPMGPHRGPKKKMSRVGDRLSDLRMLFF